ncbi:MAG: heparan-alpha-glucosaminide N-acetyltransferase domain-containing protein [Acutalibacteraceae bacterium]
MENGKRRIQLLDELRGFCIVLMVAYHAFFTLGSLFGLQAAERLFAFFSPVEPLFAGIFILLCGFSCRLSHNNLRRGALLALVAALLSLFLWLFMREEMIWFGILHCLAVCILLFSLLRPLLDRLPTAVGLIVCAILFIGTFWFPYYRGGLLGVPPLAVAWPSDWQQLWFLMPLGIGRVFSADYFPLLPWMFCFFFGSYLGRLSDRLPAFCYKRHIPPLAFLGRHSLLVYLAHQPIIYGLAFLIRAVFS